jgi:hypothetical protein
MLKPLDTSQFSRFVPFHWVSSRFGVFRDSWLVLELDANDEIGLHCNPLDFTLKNVWQVLLRSSAIESIDDGFVNFLKCGSSENGSFFTGALQRT